MKKKEDINIASTTKLSDKVNDIFINLHVINKHLVNKKFKKGNFKPLYETMRPTAKVSLQSPS